jgi:myo-inositol-1(or 4)-monophosphatase
MDVNGVEVLLDVARAAARDAAAVHRAHLGQVALEQWSEKGIYDFVTHVDREAEERIVARIRDAFPGHAILAEEGTGAGGDTGLDGEWLWVIDPLDGTTNFLHSYPAYAVSIAVLRRGVPQAGVVIGAGGEEWSAATGCGAWLDGRRSRVSAIEDPARALIGTGFPFRQPDQIPRYLRQLDRVLRSTSGVRRAGSAALDLCHVASGYFDAFWELALAPWDIAAGTLIIREAGGVITTLAGGDDVLAGGGVLAGNPALHRALGELLAEKG